MALDRQAGHRVTLVTVFLSGRDVDQRRREDLAAAKLLDCDYVCLELPDAPERPEIRGRLGIFMPYGPRHLGITNEVVSRTQKLLPSRQRVHLRAPLSVGGHIDHRIVHEAARAVAFARGPELSLSYYEDLPYALAPYSLARRLSAMDAKLDLLDGKSELPGLARAPRRDELVALKSTLNTWVAIHSLPPLIRQLGVALSARAALRADESGQRPGFRPILQPLLKDVTAQDALRRASMAAYASQWPLFCSAKAEFLDALTLYARTKTKSTSPGDSAALYERHWLDVGVLGVSP
jgi:LmbE family N-acetylglucosaminyl deacetylase